MKAYAAGKLACNLWLIYALMGIYANVFNERIQGTYLLLTRSPLMGDSLENGRATDAGACMNSHLKTLVVFFSILPLASLIYFEAVKRSKTKSLNPACEKMDIVGVKEGIVVRTEDNGRVVYVTKVWDQISTDEKDETGHWLALCRSPDERVEIRSAETGKVIRKFVIDLHYKATHGIP